MVTISIYKGNKNCFSIVKHSEGHKVYYTVVSSDYSRIYCEEHLVYGLNCLLQIDEAPKFTTLLPENISIVDTNGNTRKGKIEWD